MEKNLSDFVVESNSTLRDTIIKMTYNHLGIMLVMKEDYKLLGVISDGDVRRALLNDILLTIPVEKIMNINPIVAKSEKEAKEIITKSPFLILVPVIDNEGYLEGVISNENELKYYSKLQLIQESQSIKNQSIHKKYEVVVIIPARGGSKRIPQKNLAKIGNESLLSLAINAAKKSKYVDYIIVSTDDEMIAAEARKHGVSVPWLRPEKLALDSTKTVDVLMHAVEMLKKDTGNLPGIVVLLEPTAPLRTSLHIDESIEYFYNNTADSLVSVNEIRHNFHPEELLKTEGSVYLSPYLENRTFDSRKLRLEQDKLYVPNGLIYIVKSEILINKKSIYGEKVLKYETEPYLFCDIDEFIDLRIAELKLKFIEENGFTESDA